MASKEHFELQSELIERGIAWQVATFAAIGVAATSALAIYSETDALSFRFFEAATTNEAATTKLNWAFVPAVAFIADRSRKMFERRSEIRAAARARVREQGIKEGRKREKEEILASLDAEGVILPPEVAKRVFNRKNGQDS